MSEPTATEQVRLRVWHAKLCRTRLVKPGSCDCGAIEALTLLDSHVVVQAAELARLQKIKQAAVAWRDCPAFSKVAPLRNAFWELLEEEPS